MAMDSLDSMLVTQLLERVEKLERLALDNKRRDSVEIGTPAKGGALKIYIDAGGDPVENDRILAEGKRVLAEAQGGQ